MAIFKGQISTNKVGSRETFEFEVPDDELQGKSEREREEIIDKYCQEEMWNYAEWGWTTKQPAHGEGDD